MRMPLSTLIPHICIRVCVCVCLRVNLPFVSKFQIVETTVLLGKQSLVMRPDSYIITKLDLDWSLYQWLRTMNEERKMVTHEPGHYGQVYAQLGVFCFLILLDLVCFSFLL